MNKQNVKKITTPCTSLDVSAVSVEEKKALLEFLSKKGFNPSTFYLRFFSKGFDLWEIEGVKDCKNQFLNQPEVAKKLLEYQSVTGGDRGYLYTLAMSDTPGVFYRCLKEVKGLCQCFKDFMSEKGMSANTAFKRFTTDEWKTWELEGISSLISQHNESYLQT